MTATFNYDPYYDDFDEDKNFMRVLFKPGYAVQGRELTQLQSILSNQIEKFGNHIFKNGSPVVGGKISLDDRASYIILDSQYGGIDIIPENFEGKTIISYNSTKSVRAKVISVDNTTTNPVLVIKYLSGDVFNENDDLQIYGQNTYAKLRSTNAVGRSYVASIQDGIYYFKGQFVKVLPKSLVIELFYRQGHNSVTNLVSPSYKIGIEFEEILTDYVDDTSLLDPAQGSFNYQAPGADRYTISTTLSKRTLDSSDESSFFEVLRLVNGVKTKEIEYPIYSEIEKTLARRTYEESGNYTIDPFVLSLEDEYFDANNNVNAEMFNVTLDPGKAYVGGHEFKTIAPTKIGINRSRSTNSVTDYDLPTNYTSYVVINSVRGTLDISTFPQLDVHSVPHTNINVSTTTAYNSTKIGTIYADMIKFNDSVDNNLGTSHTFDINTFGINSSSITGTVATGSSNTVINLPTSFSNTCGNNAYANMYFRLTDAGGTAVSPIRITSSDGTARTITLETVYPFTPLASNTFSIDSDFKVAESIVDTNGLTITFAGNIDTESKDASTGYAYINEPSRSSLVFELPYEALKANTISDMDLYARKMYSNKLSGGDGKITISTIGTDTFAFAGSVGALSDSVVLDNIICFVRYDSTSNATSGISPNTVLSLANSYFSVNAVSSTTIEVNTNTVGVRADFVIKTKVNNADNNSTGAIRGKQMLPLNNDFHDKVPFNLGGANTLDSSNTGTVHLVTGGLVFEDVGGTYFDGSTLTDLRTPGTSVSLQVPDIYEIVRITDSKTTSNVSTSMLTNSLYDVTDHYEFDNGQRKTHYEHASIKLKRGYSSPSGKLYVQYRYLKHSSAPSPQNYGLFTVDSYLKTGSNMTYEDISKYSNKEDGKLISLRSSLDFRPTRVIASTSLSGAMNPDPDSVATFDYEYYLNRMDRIVVKPSGEFSVIEGKSAVSPQPAPVQGQDMLIYTLTVPAYTESVKDVRVDYVNNRRYTMEDIGKFENRIKAIEYYIALNALEKNTADSKILDSNGLERSKYGILVDNFTSTDAQATYTDVGYDNRCLVDAGTVRPASLMRTFKMKVIDSACAGTFKKQGIAGKNSLLIDYSTASFATQPFATKSISVVSALYANFRGTTKLYPEFVGDVDTDSTARVTIDSVSGIENAFTFINDALKYVSDKNPQWNTDKNSPFARVTDNKWYQTKTSVSNETINLGGRTWGNRQTTTDNVWLSKGAELFMDEISTSSSEVDLGSFVTDLAIQPYIKPRQIIFSTQAVRPNTSFYSFFDKSNVTSYVVSPNEITLNTNSQYASVEPVVFANTTSELANAAVSYYTGGSSFDYAVITNGDNSTDTVSIINETGKTLDEKYVFGLESGIVTQIKSVNKHISGMGTVTGNTIILESESSSTNDWYNGNTVYIVRESDSLNGVGESFTVTDYVGSSKTLYLSSTPESTGSIIYSIGSNKSNKFGQVSGAFYPAIATFRSGERTFRVTESFNNSYDGDSVSFADATFNSSGITVDKTTLVDTVYNVGINTQLVGKTTDDRLVSSKSSSVITSTWIVDPTAQTFFVDPQVYPYGLYIANAQLFFKSKDEGNLPVTVQIRPTVNGAPSSNYWYPESVVTKYPLDINISESPLISDSSTYTQFNFPSPVFLRPGLYALVILTDSPEYLLWEAEKGSTTSRNEYVGVNPYVGTLYKSQNSMEYVPYINEDLMFKLNRCVFSTSPAYFSVQSESQPYAYNFDTMRLLSTEMHTMTDSPISITYNVITKPVTGKETTYRGIFPHIKYSFSQDDLYILGYRRRTLENQGDVTVQIEMSTDNDAVTPLLSEESLYLNAWENFIDNGIIENTDFNIIASGTGYANSDTITVNSTTGTGANVYLSVNGSGNVTSINVVSGGSGYTDDYDITVNTSTGSGIDVVLNSEYDSSGGPCDARYITKPISLADGFDAGDLRVFLAANKPVGTEVEVFFKILSSSDDSQFKDRPYQKMACINPTSTSSLDEITYREYEYRPSSTDNFVKYTGVNGVVYDSFKTFSIKIIMTSQDSSIVPRVKDLRIIALPAE